MPLMSILSFLPVSPESVPTARRWLWLAVWSLAIGGIFAILLVASRAPGVQEHIPFRDFFHTALVIHVDLLVLVWFLGIAAMLWTLISPRGNHFLNQTGYWAFAAGSALLCATGFVEDAHPLMNNYIPVLQHPWFFMSIALMGCGIGLSAAVCCLPMLAKAWKENALAFGIASAGLITLVALVCFGLSAAQVEYQGDATWYYEQLFWAGGHMLQYTHTQLLLVAWVWLLAQCGAGFPLAGAVKAIFLLNLLLVLPMPLVCLMVPASDSSHHFLFTEHMRWGLSIGPVAMVMLMFFRRTPSTRAENWKIIGLGLLCSLVLFAEGGIVGHTISGYNTTIPAHYHASIVAVTITFMALCYSLSGAMGYGAVTGRLPLIQLALYTFGQFVHVIGLAISGDAGAMRKTAETVTDPTLKFTMKIATQGAGLALIGGFLFVWIMLRLSAKRRAPQPA